LGKFNSPQEFITALVPGAQKGYQKYGIFASVTIAQALQEAGWTMKADCAKIDNNLFGIKTDGAHDPSLDMGGGSLPSDGTGGQYCHYATVADGVEDHGYFLKHNKRYTEGGVFSAKTPEDQARAIAQSHYAGSNQGEYDAYESALKALIKQYNLKQYDTGSYTGDGDSGNATGSSSTDSNPLISWDENYKPKVWETDLSRVTKTSKHKKMSFFGADVQQPQHLM
jgi:flagellum-specific peptidoglycan hydrolase FlgJ